VIKIIRIISANHVNVKNLYQDVTLFSENHFLLGIGTASAKSPYCLFTKKPKNTAVFLICPPKRKIQKLNPQFKSVNKWHLMAGS
jgi:hypothetical protein